MKKIAIIGCGFLGNIIADAMKKGLLADYTLAGAMSRQKADAEKLCAGLGGEAVESLDELLALNPDMVIETASVAMVREACIPTLEHGADFIPLSIGAFADAAFYQKAQEAARAHGVHIYIPHGAVGGFDVLQTIALMAEAGDMRSRPASRPARDRSPSRTLQSIRMRWLAPRRSRRSTAPARMRSRCFRRRSMLPSRSPSRPSDRRRRPHGSPPFRRS